MKKFLLSFILVLFAVNFAFADGINDWKKIIKERTCVLWADAQLLDDIVLNARGNASITWLPRALLRTFEKNKEADEWVVRGLNFYYSNTNKKKLNGRDVVAINYKAVKTWNFNINNFKFENYNISSDDILSNKNEYITGELNSGFQAVVYLAVPSKIFKPGKDVKIYLGDDSVIMHLPKR
ncbi:MAG: hypothetical protein II870_05670 [Synergistaceae bacterium]|nr:hypothetical protein [Synergistaceae bacterium]